MHHFVGRRFVGLRSIFADAARALKGLLESQIEHPLAHFFHPRHVHKSLPRIPFLVFVFCWKSTRSPASLDGQAHEELCPTLG
jgi:hypothetical protein